MSNDPVKAKLIELVPDIKRRLYNDEMATYEEDEIRLADVLRAIEECKGYHDEFVMYSEGTMEYIKTELLAGPDPEVETFTTQWNLTTDYDNQTQEVKDFIGKLIGV